MLFVLLCIALLTIAAKTQQNYQNRTVYYDENENVCHYGQHSDIIRFNIKLEGFPLLSYDDWGWTLCNNH